MASQVSNSSAIDWAKIKWLLVALILVSAIAMYLLVSFSPNLVLEENGVQFVSKDSVLLSTHFDDLKNETRFLVSVDLRSGEGVSNSYLANAGNLFLVVLIGNQKEVTMLFRSVDSENRLLSCRTNRGNVLTDEELSVSDCVSFSDLFPGTRVLVQWPDSRLAINKVLFGDHAVTIQSKDFESLGLTSMRLLVKPFPNSQSILDSVNELATKVK